MSSLSSICASCLAVITGGNSAIDSALLADGRLSFPCKRFLAHRHSQHLLEAFFAGDFPYSKARIPIDAGLIQIILQLVFFFLPGTFCEVGSPGRTHHSLHHRLLLLSVHHYFCPCFHYHSL